MLPTSRNEGAGNYSSEERSTLHTSVLHDVEEGDHDAGDGLEERRGIPPAVRVDHLAQCVVQDPPPHRDHLAAAGGSARLASPSAAAALSRLRFLPRVAGGAREREAEARRGHALGVGLGLGWRSVSAHIAQINCRFNWAGPVKREL